MNTWQANLAHSLEKSVEEGGLMWEGGGAARWWSMVKHSAHFKANGQGKGGQDVRYPRREHPNDFFPKAMVPPTNSSQKSALKFPAI